MTDDERRAFSNLILLCKPHHDWVDRLHSDRFPPETLQQWKTARERGQTSELRGLPALNQNQLTEMINSAIGTLTPQRIIVIELKMGAYDRSGQLITIPAEEFQSFMAEQSAMFSPAVLITTRNQGTLPAYIDAYFFFFGPNNGEIIITNTLPRFNTALPHRLDVGESVNWITPLEPIAAIVNTFAKIRREVEWIDSRVRLGSGETITSNQLRVRPGIML